jgi:hypothetical protein
MRSSSPVLKSTWIPNSILEFPSCSSLAMLLCYFFFLFCFFPDAMEGSPLFKSSLLIYSVDLNINFLISSITLSSCSSGWLFLCSLLCCNSSFLSVGRSTRYTMLYLSPLVALSCHLTADSESYSLITKLLLLTSSSDRLSSVSSSRVGISPTFSNRSSGWYTPPSISNLTSWM